MRSIQYAPAAAPQTQQMALVRMPTGDMGWVPAQTMNQMMGMGQMAPSPGNVPAVTSLKTILWLGGLGLVGWWAWKKWGKGAMQDMGFGGGGSRMERMEEGRGSFVRSRRRRRSRSRLLSEFQRFLDEDDLQEVREVNED